MPEPDYLGDDLWGDEDEDTLKDRYLIFRIGEEEYGIEIRFVTEIVSVQKITDVPDMPSFVKGVINLRGQVIPVVDVRVRFKIEERAYDDRTCTVIVDIDGTLVGLVVDTVREVLAIPEDCVSPPPAVNRGAGGRFIQGLGRSGEDVKILLDVNKLLYDEELEQLSGEAVESSQKDSDSQKT